MLDTLDIVRTVGMDHRGIRSNSMRMVDSNMGKVDTDREGNTVGMGDADDEGDVGGVGGVGDVGGVDGVDGVVDADLLWD